MIRNLLATISVGVLAAAAPSALAQNYDEDTGFYIQGGYSYLNMEPEGSDDGVDTHALTIRPGIQMSRNLGFELDITSGIDDGEFDYNVDEDQVDFDDNGDNDFDDTISGAGGIQLNYLIGAYARGVWNLSDQLDVSARVGYAYVDVDAEVLTIGGNTLSIADSEDGFSAGAGAAWDLSENWELRGDYTWYGFDEVDASAGTITLGYTF